jgi:hypothetical protein
VAAAVILIVAIQQIWTATHHAPQELMLRGPGFEAVLPPQTSPPRPLENGGFLLAWQGVEGADAYHVIIYAADLSELVTLDAAGASQLEVDPADLPALAQDDGELLWRVVVLRDGEELSRSGLQPLRPVPEALIR